jgi:cephalosporin hydroxylase
MAPAEERGSRKPEEFLRLYEQMDDLLKAMRACVERDREKAQDAVSTLVRVQTAQGLAAQFLDRKRPYEANAQLAAMIQDGLLHHAAFIQKAPRMLSFYRWLLFAFEQEPRSVLEIGVKGGGSTAFWKALFPAATVVGLDLKLRRWLVGAPSEDGVIYIEGDQTDTTRLDEIARQYGPFDIVIDDGSHVVDHQASTMRCLLPHVRAGGFYVVEDTHTSVKKPGHTGGDYGTDIWADFTLAVFQRLRKGPPPPPSEGTRLASDMASMIENAIIGTQVLAVRAAART